MIGAESERCASFSSALKAGKPVYTKADSTLADGLAVPKVGVNSLATAAPLVDKCVVVKEEYIAMAILRYVLLSRFFNFCFFSKMIFKVVSNQMTCLTDWSR